MTKIKRLASAMLASCMMFSALTMNAGAADQNTAVDRVDGMLLNDSEVLPTPSESYEVTPYSTIYSNQFVVDSDGYTEIGTTPEYTANTHIELYGMWNNDSAKLHILLENIDGSTSAYMLLSNKVARKTTIFNKGRYRIKVKSSIDDNISGMLQITADC